MAAPRKYDDVTRREIDRLVNLEGRTATETATLIENGQTEAPPQKIPEATLRLLARQLRTDINERPKHEQLRELTGLAVRVIHDGFARQQAKPAEADPDDTLKLVRSLRELEPLLTDKPQEKANDGPRGTLGGLASVPTPNDNANTTDLPAAPVSARATSG